MFKSARVSPVGLSRASEGQSRASAELHTYGLEFHLHKLEQLNKPLECIISHFHTYIINFAGAREYPNA